MSGEGLGVLVAPDGCAYLGHLGPIPAAPGALEAAYRRYRRGWLTGTFHIRMAGRDAGSPLSFEEWRARRQ